MEKFCKSCGMPMDKPEDFADNDTNSNYCCYCGEKKDYENKEESYEKPNFLEKEEYYKKKEVKSRRKKVKKKVKKKTKKKSKRKK